MPTYEFITYEKKDRIVYVTLNRPQILNAYNDQMAEELNDAWFQFDADPEAHVAILSGAGRAFCSGADVRQRQLRPREELERLGGPSGRNAQGAGLSQTVNWKPVIAAIHGYAYGAGWALVANQCDVIIAAEGTKIQLTEIRRGLSGANLWASAWFYTGTRFANEIALTAREFTAEEGLANGLVNRVVPADQLIQGAEQFANEMMQNPPLSVRSVVRMIRWYKQEMGRAAQLYSGPLHLHLTDDFREAATAFLEKRPPEFHGR